MFALDSLVRNAVQQSVNVLHPENAPAPLDSAIHLESYPFDVRIKVDISLVVEFQKWWVLKCKMFVQESTYS